MTVNKIRASFLAIGGAFALLPFSAAIAQRQPVSPEQRIERLERQLDQVQRQVFPRGRPADTAGYSGEPAATQSAVTSLTQRLDAIERQMADMLRQSEETGYLARTVQSELAKIRSDNEARLAAMEQRLAAAPVAEPVETPVEARPATSERPRPSATTSTPTKPVSTATTATVDGSDPGEAAYTEGFKLWEAGRYDQAITSLRAFVSAYPKHRRVSFANNLVGRALLDKGQPRAAAQALLANYRNNPGGERAADSLYYLGQSLMKLDPPQRRQACNFYAEIEAIYGAKVRPDLQKLVDAAKTEAQCS